MENSSVDEERERGRKENEEKENSVEFFNKLLDRSHFLEHFDTDAYLKVGDGKWKSEISQGKIIIFSRTKQKFNFWLKSNIFISKSD